MCLGRGKREIQGSWLGTNSPTSVTTAFRRCPSPSDQLKLTNVPPPHGLSVLSEPLTGLWETSQNLQFLLHS